MSGVGKGGCTVPAVPARVDGAYMPATYEVGRREREFPTAVATSVLELQTGVVVPLLACQRQGYQRHYHHRACHADGDRQSSCGRLDKSLLTWHLPTSSPLGSEVAPGTISLRSSAASWTASTSIWRCIYELQGPRVL